MNGTIEEEEPVSTPPLFYWLLAGVLTGFGVIALLSIGIPFLLVGCSLLMYGIFRFRGRGCWAFLVGFGTLPALILTVQFVGSPLPICTMTITGLSYTSRSGITTGGCYPSSYYTMAIFFGCIALLGGFWPFLRVFLRRLSTRS